MSDQLELQHQSELADARLSVAENLGWPMSILAATGVQCMWQNWLLTILTLVVVYFMITFKYRREAEKAEDAHYRASSLGKYAIYAKKENT